MDENTGLNMNFLSKTKSDFALSRQLEKWKALSPNWLKLFPSAIPSSEDIANFKQLLQEALCDGTKGAIIVLGSTPQIRDMLASTYSFKNLKVVCVDFSLEMYNQATKSLKYHNPNERFVLADWRNFDIGEAEYDVVLGDKVIDSIALNDWPSFFQRICFHLRSSGQFITHIATTDPKYKDVTFSDALGLWSDLYEHNSVSFGEAVSSLWDELLTASAFKDGYFHNSIRIGRFSYEIENFRNSLLGHASPATRRLFNEFYRCFWSTRDYEWSSYTYDQFIKEASNYFTHSKTVYSTDYQLAKLQPIVSLSV